MKPARIVTNQIRLANCILAQADREARDGCKVKKDPPPFHSYQKNPSLSLAISSTSTARKPLKDPGTTALPDLTYTPTNIRITTALRPGRRYYRYTSTILNTPTKSGDRGIKKRNSMAGRSSTSSHPSRRTSSPTDLNSSSSSSSSSSSPTKGSKDSLRREIEGIEAEASKLRAELASLRQERKVLATVVQSLPGKSMSVL
ncbi:hypothetical protein TWF481_011726 [Arthrobotrys musiformis]|uniref:Uncharacterized protein n=1 Tax=Arthrobotrys musiformis TaxID=47236 RepID=A0AAV9VZ44_9PEZI